MGARAARAAGGAGLSGYQSSDRARYVAEDPARKRTDRDDFARDRGRIVHASALRRLSTKTQVWQAGADDFVRNRLTHSLEVAQIGRELAQGLGCNPDVVDAACLAHDIGHPPYGHFGEQVLDELFDDVGGFEGNAQTFRILTRLEPKRQRVDGRSVGLNLTRATLDAATKYPWQRGARGPAVRKFGVYADDLDVFTFARATAGPSTCLEAQVMDWSDDVAYSVHDVEDGIAAHAIPLRALRSPQEQQAVVDAARRRYAPTLDEAVLASALTRLVENVVPTSFTGNRMDLAALKDMTSTLISRFAAAPEDATRDRYGPGSLARYAATLVVPEQVRAEVAVLKGAAAHFVMFTPARDAQHVQQREIIEGLVERYRTHPEELDPMFRADFAAASSEAAARRVIADQVASLTDSSAGTLYRRAN